MKTVFTLFVFLFAGLVHAQALLETVSGEELAIFSRAPTTTTFIGNVNTSEQSIQFRSLLTFSNPRGPTPSHFMGIGAKGKPSDGIATLFSGGNFNAGTGFNVSYTKVKLFSRNTPKVVDIFSVKADYNIGKNTLIQKDSLPDQQVKNFTAHGGGLSLHYNVLIDGKTLLTFAVGYLRNNNYSTLDQVTLKKYAADSTAPLIKEYSQTVNGREGAYREFNSFPLRVGYVFCPSLKPEDVNKLKVGFSVYYATEFGNKIPQHNVGGLVFLTKQDKKSGLRLPLIGAGLQLNDITDNRHTGESLAKHITFNVFTSFSVFSL